MSVWLSVDRCDACNSSVRYLESYYPYFKKFVMKIRCANTFCGFSKVICSMCKNSINVEKHKYYSVAYFEHILGHYDLAADYIFWLRKNVKFIDRLYLDSIAIYNNVRQLLFISVDGPITNRHLIVSCTEDFIKELLKDKVYSCSICKQNGIDTFYEVFPSLEVIISHITKVHVESSCANAELPKLLDFVRDVKFE